MVVALSLKNHIYVSNCRLPCGSIATNLFYFLSQLSLVACQNKKKGIKKVTLQIKANTNAMETSKVTSQLKQEKHDSLLGNLRIEKGNSRIRTCQTVEQTNFPYCSHFLFICKLSAVPSVFVQNQPKERFAQWRGVREWRNHQRKSTHKKSLVGLLEILLGFFLPSISPEGNFFSSLLVCYQTLQFRLRFLVKR